MGLNAATLDGHRVTSARASIPAWGAWYADASLDGEVSLSGSVPLVVGDLTLRGTVLSGGPSKGRSDFRIVAGAGGWGRTLPKKSYANDAGVKVSTILGDAAAECGETFDVGTNTTRVGPAWVRPEGPASRLLELLAPGAWYIDAAGVTRLGRRPRTALTEKVTHGPVDVARGTVTIAAESIAPIVPGVVVDGLEALDVQHDISAKGGLRSTIWGKQAATGSRRMNALRAVGEQLDPFRKFRGVTEYRVVTLEGKRANLQPVRVSTGMPDLRRVPVRGVAGVEVVATLGSRVLVGFVDSDPARPYVSSHEDPDGEGFQPTTLTLLAGGSAGGEHIATVEGVTLLLYNTLVALMVAAGGGPLLAAVLQPLLATAISAALAAQAVPAPPGSTAQNAASAALQAGFAAGTTPSPTMFAAWVSAIAALSTKTSNESGLFPSLGSANVEAG